MSLIDFVRGTVAARDVDGVVLSIGGFGIRALASSTTLNALPEHGREAMLHTYLVVREDALTLYGFATIDERAMFVQLLSVGGIGPKVALGTLSAATPEHLAAMIEAGDIAALSRLPGIGRKTAQRIVLDLKGKLDVSQTTGGVPVAAAGTASGAVEVAAAALRELGFNPAEVGAAVAGLPRDRELSEDEAVRLALAALSSRR